MVGLAAIVAVFASDLLVTNGLPEFLSKLVVLSSVGFSILSIGIIASSAAVGEKAGSWISLRSVDRVQLGKFLNIAVQLGLLVLVVRLFRLENQPSITT